MLSPLQNVKRRLSGAIDWRVHEAVTRAELLTQEHLAAEIAALREAMMRLSATLTDDTRRVSELVERLHQRLVVLERRSGEESQPT